MASIRGFLSRKWKPGLAFPYALLIASSLLVVKQYATSYGGSFTPDQGAVDFWNLNPGRWDNSLSFKIHDYVTVGRKFREESSRSNVCLATQASIDSVHWLPYLTRHWGGFVSLATITTRADYNCTLSYMRYLKQCHPDVMDKVAVHLVFPSNETYAGDSLPADELVSWPDEFSCSTHERKALRELCSEQQVQRWRTGERDYPQNLLRNLARKGCNTEYVYLADIDIIPNQDMSALLEEFLRTNRPQCDKCAYVIPAFELEEKSRFPGSKNELLQLEKDKLAQPYRFKAFAQNQKATNYDSWRSFEDIGGKVAESHNVTKYEFLYEPFYVSRDTAPPHDERFLGYGFTRNTQVYEMVRAGWQFRVISPVFGIHWGLKKKFDRPQWQIRQTDVNRKRYKQFKKEIEARYESVPQNKAKPNQTVIAKTNQTKS